jgi:hypothetical protein
MKKKFNNNLIKYRFVTFRLNYISKKSHYTTISISKCIKLFITSVEKVIEFKFKNIKIMVYSYVKPSVEKTIS